MLFQLNRAYHPKGDQEQAIDQLTEGVNKNYPYQTLLGITGSGKTFTMANVIEKVQKPTLILSHNKTLAAQLYREFKEFFPENSVEYFVSYYDYYQPEAYVAAKDLYIEKDASINEEIERLRLSATAALLGGKDIIVVATVSSIFGLGSPDDYRDLTLYIKKGMVINRKELIKKLVEIQYERKETDFGSGSFRVRGDNIDVHLSYSKNLIRIELFGDEIEGIKRLDALTGKKLEDIEHTLIYPAKHFVTKREKIENTVKAVFQEMNERVAYLKSIGKEFEAHRIHSRTVYDMEILQEMGYCKGIENYSGYLSGRNPGDRPYTLIDYFPDDFLCFIDESHITVPQIGGMYNGDHARKQALVDYGFRLPSALDNRPLNFNEFLSVIPQMIFVSATPSKFEMEKSTQIVRQIIRPTGLLDPEIIIKPSEGQIDDLMEEIRKTVLNHERVLVTTLTKKMAEELSGFLSENGVKVRWLHSEVETVERVELLMGLRQGEFDVLVGINLLREGLDLPEVSLVAILDADKVGFLRSTTSLVQIIGRAARNVHGRVIMYCDRISDSMKEAITLTEDRRKSQIAYNEQHGITPETIQKEIKNILERKLTLSQEENKNFSIMEYRKKFNLKLPSEKAAYLKNLEEKMFEAAKDLNFEDAAKIRDEIKRIKEQG
ncbi:MAG TPA: excinuclease ABC subunit B [Spirochaetia bacterium]|nr:MAG: excinuclease ABC subunit B [Spirochaetes bacterium GWB1_36_13]HCL55873.1 excinuclease ABC subunit B [Spirochaetia bacterium]